jgi:hypothetical protein
VHLCSIPEILALNFITPDRNHMVEPHFRPNQNQSSQTRCSPWKILKWSVPNFIIAHSQVFNLI